jgi:hypothetical protein
VGELTHGIIKNLDKYLDLLVTDTAIHDIGVGDSSLNFKILMRNDTKLSHKIKLPHILSIYPKTI